MIRPPQTLPRFGREAIGLSRRLYFAAIAGSFLLAVSAGCGSNQPRMRSREDIFEARVAVDTLFITADGQREIAPGNRRGMIVHKESGKIASIAWECQNPNCPGRKEGEPFLFPWIDPLAEVGADGKIAVRSPETEEDLRLAAKFGEHECSECLKIRDKAKESVDDQIRYKSWCVPHVLPQAKEQLKQLEEELQRNLERLRERTGKKDA